MKGTVMNLDELLEREAIREMLTRYVGFADGGKVNEMLDLFSDDAIMEPTGASTCRGRNEIRGYFEAAGESIRALMPTPMLRHHLSSIRIDLLGDNRARSTAYFLAVTEFGPDHWGRYRDQLLRTDDGWCITHRLLEIEGGTPDGWFSRHMAAIGDPT